MTIYIFVWTILLNEAGEHRPTNQILQKSVAFPTEFCVGHTGCSRSLLGFLAL